MANTPGASSSRQYPPDDSYRHIAPATNYNRSSTARQPHQSSRYVSSTSRQQLPDISQCRIAPAFNSSRSSATGEGEISSRSITSASRHLPSSDDSYYRIPPAANSDRSVPNGQRSSFTSSNRPDISNSSTIATYAEKLPPARATHHNQVELISNFFDIQTRSKTIFRYDVCCKVNFINHQGRQKSIDLSGGPKNDACRIENGNICMVLLKSALQSREYLRDGTGLVYDGSTQAYLTREIRLHRNENDISMIVEKWELHEDIVRSMKWKNVLDFTVHVTPNSTMPFFDINDYSRESGINIDEANKDVTNFLNLLTSQQARENGFSLFGNGKLFKMDQRPVREYRGQELRHGADKGIKFIEDRERNHRNGDVHLMPALCVDVKAGYFFIPQIVIESLKDRFGEYPNIDWRLVRNKKPEDVKCPEWNKINEYVKGIWIDVQLQRSRQSFRCAGISTMMVEDIEEPHPTEDQFLSKIDDWSMIFGKNEVRRLDTYLPALRVTRSRKNRQGDVYYVDEYWPMDYATIMPCQRVPLSKQMEPPRPIKPTERFKQIEELMEDLKLDGSRRNELLNSFGVAISPTTKIVTGIQREAPSIMYEDRIPVQLNREKASWSSQGKKAVYGSSVDLMVIGYTNHQDEIARSASKLLRQKCYEWGVRIGDYNLERVNRMKDIENILKKLSELSTRKSCIFVFIDEEVSGSHGILKYFERVYEVPTQQITMENASKLRRTPLTAENIIKKMNCKLGGLNYIVQPELYGRDHWINSEDTLIISYDLSHPQKPNPNDSIIVTSTIGFSFNGGEHKEAFVGDYHYQYPNQEQVDSNILIERVAWMLDLFQKHRGRLPKKIVIIRDGVSDGQYPMVMREEFGAIKRGCARYAQMCNKRFEPVFALFIATKRHNCRFVERGSQNILFNPRPLTMIDTHVTRPNINEFYAFTTTPPQGTSKCVYLQLLINEFFKNSDECQSLITALAFHHQIVNSPISLPEPVYQADEWAERGKLMWEQCRALNGLRMLKADGREIPDYAAMTDQLSMWTSKFNGTRVNA